MPALEPFRLRKAEAPVHALCCDRVTPDTIEQKGSGSAHGDLVFKLNTPAFQDLKVPFLSHASCFCVRPRMH